MAHVAKYPRSAIGHMLAHYDRSKSGLGDNIDPARTCQNYNLATHQTLPQLDYLHQRLQEVRCRRQKDVNILCDWVVTAPKDLDPKEHDAFFRSVYGYLENKYGRDNVISAYVHMDEAQPHIHFAFIPVTTDKKRGDLKVAAKEVITRTELQRFHPDLQRHVERDLGHHVSILNGATEKGNRSIKELKRESATERLEQAKASVDSINAVYKAKKGVITAIDQAVQAEPRHEPEYRRRRLFAPKEKVIVLTEHDYLQMQHLVDAAVKILETQKDFEAALQEISERDYVKKQADMETDLRDKDRKIQSLQSDKEHQANLAHKYMDISNRLIDKHRQIIDIMSRMPQAAKDAFREDYIQLEREQADERQDMSQERDDWEHDR